jgi:hypothetical protein
MWELGNAASSKRERAAQQSPRADRIELCIELGLRKRCIRIARVIANRATQESRGVGAFGEGVPQRSGEIARSLQGLIYEAARERGFRAGMEGRSPCSVCHAGGAKQLIRTSGDAS